MTDCICGLPVRLGASRITVNRKRGVYHYIAHLNSGTPACGGDWTCAALKPYPKDESQRESRKLVARWEAFVAEHAQSSLGARFL